MYFLIGLITTVTIYTLVCQSYNLVMGFAGQFHLGHVALVGIGAYTFALLTLKTGTPFMLALLLGAVVAMLAGIAIGRATLPFKGHYLVIVTYGFTEIMKAIELNWIDLTNGSRGLTGIPRPSMLGFSWDDNIEFMIFTFVIVALCHFIMYRFLSSPYGLLLEGVREDEIAVETIGRDTVKVKLIAMGISGFFAGVAGALFVSYLSIATPEDYGLTMTITILLMVLLGGRGSFIGGGIIGPIAIYLIFEPLKFLDIPDSLLGPLRMFIYAMLFILIMLLRPQGIVTRKALKIRMEENT